MLCQLAPFFKPGRKCSRSLEKPLRAVASNAETCEPHGDIISARKTRLGQSQSAHVLGFFFGKKEKEERGRGERKKERRKGGRERGKEKNGEGKK